MYKGCLDWIERGLASKDSNFQVTKGKLNFVTMCGDAELQSQIHGTEIANIWAACDGGKDNAAKELLECRLLSGESCTAEFASVDFEPGFVWIDTGYDFIRVSKTRQRVVMSALNGMLKY
jgi:hypothetical protein